MTNGITVKLEGRYGSIEDLTWPDVPPFAVLTGVNGAGKSQLLEVIAAQYGAWEPRNPSDPSSYQVQGKILGTHMGPGGEWVTYVRAEIEGDEFAPGEVFHSYDEWHTPRATTATEEQVKEAIKILYGPDTLVPEGMKIRAAIASKRGIPPEEVRNLSPGQFYEDLTPRQLVASMGGESSTNLPLLFLTYQLFKREAQVHGLSKEEAIRRYGEPPWLLLNEILETSGLPFRLVVPGELNPSSLFVENTYTLILHDIQKDEEVPFEGLSSGEKVIMSTVYWRYNAQQMGTYPRFLLLDEPDAHLHPSLARRFLDVIRKVFVEEREVRVIMTTHSPSTVALTPEESLFEIRRTATPRIQPVKSKTRTIATLTDGFVVVQEAMQTVFLEGDTDPGFYSLVWELLTKPKSISEAGPLEPSPSLAFFHRQGKKSVEDLVHLLRGLELESYHGIIDKDESNSSSEGVHVVQRYGVENYLYDPLNVWVLLHSKGELLDVPGTTVIRGQEETAIRNFSDEKLQEIANTVLHRVETELTPLKTEEQDRVEVTFVNGRKLGYPKWFLNRNAHHIEAAFRRCFGPKWMKAAWLLGSYATLNMVP